MTNIVVTTALKAIAEEPEAALSGTVAKTVDDLNSKPGSLYYAMWAIDKATGNNVSIAYIGAGRGSVLNTVDDYIAAIKKSGNDTEALKELGMTYEFGDVTDIQIGGLVYKKMATTLSSDTLSVRQDYCIAKKGDYLIVIYLTAMIDTEPGEFLNAFSGIN